MRDHMTKIRRAALALSAAGTMAIAGTVAQAHVYTAATSTTVRYVEADGKFKGRIDSNRPNCKGHGSSRLKRITPDGSKVVGSDVSGTRGRWRISEPNAAGTYRAVVRARDDQGGNATHNHQCLRAASGTVTVDP